MNSKGEAMATHKIANVLILRLMREHASDLRMCERFGSDPYNNWLRIAKANDLNKMDAIDVWHAWRARQ